MKYISSLTLVLLILGLLSVAPIASSSQAVCDKPALRQMMQASFHRVNDTRVLLLAGVIGVDSGKDVRPFIRNTKAYEEVWMCSGGGRVSAGIEIGQALNAAKATVKTPNNFLCASACTIAAMGGYARIIEPEAQFVTHASSSAKSFGYEVINGKDIKFTFFEQYDCNVAWMAQQCDLLRTFFSKKESIIKKYTCTKIEDVLKINTKCYYFDFRNSQYNLIRANSKFTSWLSVDPKLTYNAVAIKMRYKVSAEADLLAYFQTMLLDGRRDLINSSSYRKIKANFLPINIYAPEHQTSYKRDLKQDLELMQKAFTDLEQTFAIWQTVLTDTELSLKTQLSQYISANNIQLGPAGDDALKMYDAMRTCQIQSSCRLEPHTARALGYHNMYGYE